MRDYIPIITAVKNVDTYVREHLDKSDPTPEFGVYVVWFCYILGGWKCLVSTTLPDGMYYEVTYDTNRDRIYLDAYKKLDNVEVLV